jgi:hypothetical protein
MVSSRLRASNDFSNTTVLAQDKDKPNTSAAPNDQPHHEASPIPKSGTSHLHDSSRHGETFNRKQVGRRKMQAYAEHQQHDADFRKLRSDIDVGHKAWRRRSDNDASHKITN